MIVDLITRLIEAGTPAALVAEVAMLIAHGDADRQAIEARRATERERTSRYRARGGGDIPGWMRQEVFERDGYRCVDCGAEDRLECDHVTPLMHGGETTLENLQTLCKPCNARKRDRVRKADKRGQTRTAAETEEAGGLPGISSNQPPLLDKETLSPTPPIKEINHTPRVIGALARKAAGFGPPDAVEVDRWNVFCSQRKKALTSIAYSRILKTLTDAASVGWPPGELIDRSIESGWETVYVPKEAYGGRRNGAAIGVAGNRQPGGGRSQDGFLNAIREATDRG